ncbi:MAG: Rad52/Rad22 family DNA repair protein [Acidobacteriota bacterium]|nr:Rad52/Rad22 family DNA repair protein [Acidobacteriota bacterium]
MAAIVTAEKNSTDRREKRAQSIAAMGLVNREGDRFRVSTPSLRGKQTSYEVWRDANAKIRCNCLEFEESVTGDPAFRCEHILAVKYSLLAKNSEQVTKQPAAATTAEPVQKAEEKPAEEPASVKAEEAVSQTATEPGVSAPDEQKSDETQVNASADGQAETKKAEPRPLANTKGKKEMKQEKAVKDIPFVTAEEASEMENSSNNNNVVSGNFPSTLRQLRQHVEPHLVKQREGWRDRNGNTHYVDYVEWHTVADILDNSAPNWNHTVKDIRQIGEIFTVTVAITIDGVTREGIGTGTADSELGIKKAEHDALKRAAVKFGIARDLYKKESDVIERDGAVPVQQQNGDGGGFPSNPIAKSLGDLVTAKQLGMIRALAREAGVDVEEECQAVLNCKTDELSKKAASSFISHLQNLQGQNDVQINQPLRKVG